MHTRLPGAEEEFKNGYRSLSLWFNLSVHTKSSHFSNCRCQPILKCAFADLSKPNQTLISWTTQQGCATQGSSPLGCKPTRHNRFKNSGRCNVGSSPNITNLRIDWVLQYFYEFQDRNIACVYDMACNLILHNDIDHCGMSEPKKHHARHHCQLTFECESQVESSHLLIYKYAVTRSHYVEIWSDMRQIEFVLGDGVQLLVDK